MFWDISGTLVPMMIFSIPIVAIVGGIASRIAQTTARARIQELLIQERIKAIEKGMVPPTAPPMMDLGGDSPEYPIMPMQYQRRRMIFGLRLGAMICILVGGTISWALWATGEGEAWHFLMIPVAVGVALLIGSMFVPQVPDSSPK